MLARSCGRLLAPSSMWAIAPRSVAGFAAPGLVRTTPTLRTFASAVPALNTIRQPSPAPEGDEYSSVHRLGYLLDESPEPSQETLIAQLQDSQLEHLPIVLDCGKQWQQLKGNFTLPRQDRTDTKEDALSPYQVGFYVYNTFHLPSGAHLKRFHREVSEKLETQARAVNAVVFLDSRSRTVTVGLPSYIGIQPPYPAKDNSEQVIALLRKYRSQSTAEEEKQSIMSELRRYVIPRGFRKMTWAYHRYLFTLFESIRKVTAEQLLGGKITFSNMGTLGDEVPPKPKAKTAMRPQKQSGKNRKTRLAERLQAGNPRLPEAGTFVAPDGDAHKGDQDDALEDHVPFPKPSAEEMGIGKQGRSPRSNPSPAETLQAHNPKLSEAGTFVAADGNAHKADGGEKLEDHVPFPKPSAEEMGIEKPTSSQAEKLQTDDPKLPEAGTFVAPDGDAHEPSKGETDALEEHVPFPKPSADEMGIKKPTET